MYRSWVGEWFEANYWDIRDCIDEAIRQVRGPRGIFEFGWHGEDFNDIVKVMARHNYIEVRIVEGSSAGGFEHRIGNNTADNTFGYGWNRQLVESGQWDEMLECLERIAVDYRSDGYECAAYEWAPGVLELDICW